MTGRARKQMETRIGWSTESKIYVYGHDLTEEMTGKFDLGAMAFLESTGRLSSKSEGV